MAFSYRDTQIVKGMLERGDRQHDIAAFFGVNGGRVAEVRTGNCDYPTAQPLPPAKLPPPGPYVGAKTVFEIRSALEAAREKIVAGGQDTDDAKTAIAAINTALAKL